MEKTSAITNKNAIAILGGTFDPVHHGHLRLALDLAETLNVQELRLMPDFLPVHRDSPGATADQRLDMLELALNDIAELSVDDREIRRKGPSYTLLSLKEIREEVGCNTPIYFILGEDAFSHFDSWHQWQEITLYCHLLVAIRPGHKLKMSEQLQSFVNDIEYKLDITKAEWPSTAAGRLIRIKNPMLEISSSDIRQRLKENKNIRYLLPATVVDYIEERELYFPKKEVI